MKQIDQLPTFCAYHPLYVGSQFQMSGPIPLEGDNLSHGICLDCYREFCRREGIEVNEDVVKSMSSK